MDSEYTSRYDLWVAFPTLVLLTPPASSTEPRCTREQTHSAPVALPPYSLTDPEQSALQNTTLPAVPPAPPHLTLHPAPPTTTAPALMQQPRRMAEAVPLFYRDQVETENASDFIKAFNRSMLFLNPLSTDAQKIQALENYLGTGSPAEGWYDDLTATQCASWDNVVKVFNNRWPTTKSTMLTSEEYQTELLKHKMAEEDIGTIKTVGCQKVWAHVKWVEEAMELARLAKIENGPTLIWQVKKQLPKAVKKLLDKEYTSWKEFMDDVKDLSMSKLKQEHEEIEERKRKEEERDSRLMQKLEATKRATTADITAQLQ
ncbi:hypothetical protein M404DRAFT_32545 [Pisolithus tinctorius Marx 270]|uniref:Retrotransposon gag domain-containing protein n=1 Tax=Pisolithus tinctorius Marx 270 TaxID=870435 RepID=A0A0C3NNK5_PISTI|nr:hypothetical protein M404DRAFT_32545 [Pisolithus tinctorius Marx 270]